MKWVRVREALCFIENSPEVSLMAWTMTLDTRYHVIVNGWKVELVKYGRVILYARVSILLRVILAMLISLPYKEQ